VLEITGSFGLKVTNTWFKKDDKKLISCESGGSKTNNFDKHSLITKLQYVF